MKPFKWSTLALPVLPVILLLSMTRPAGAGALLLHSSGSGAPDVQAKIAGTGLIAGPVDLFDISIDSGGTPTLALLQSYDAVMIWTWGGITNSGTLGDRLADYVDGGGGVVHAVFAHELPALHVPAGRWRTGNYQVWQAGPDVRDDGPKTLGAVHQPLHPIMAGVASFDGGPGSFRILVAGLNPGAAAVADWNTGTPLVAVNTAAFAGAVAGLNFFPLSSDLHPNYWDSSTDGALLMANALNYVADPTSPAIPEPSTCLLFGFGALGLIAWRRRRAPRSAGADGI